MIRYAFLLLLIMSCKTKHNCKVTSPKLIESNKPIKDTDGDPQLDTFDFMALNMEKTKDEPKENMQSRPNPPKSLNRKEEKIQVINAVVNDNTTDIDGLLSYSIPDRMSVGDEYVIRLRISKDSDKVTIVQGDREITINDTTIKSNIYIESIRVEPIMSADLISDKDAFDITRTSSEIQNIDSGYTEWSWLITPLKSGENYLKLVVKVKSEGVNKDITVFDKKIKVKSDVVFSLKTFINQYWQWIMTTIVIPIILFFYKKYKK